jgi:hypothetical protein
VELIFGSGAGFGEGYRGVHEALGELVYVRLAGAYLSWALFRLGRFPHANSMTQIGTLSNGEEKGN